MTAIHACELPQDALLNKYKQEGAYTDCYFMDVQRGVSHAEYIEAFYTTPLFKAERSILALLAGKPSNDLQARQLACGQARTFAAWSVEGQDGNQLLLCDFLGRTRSWLMSVVRHDENSISTRLYFGSAVVPKETSKSGRKSFGFAFHALHGFHHLYTRALMQSALLQLSKP